MSSPTRPRPRLTAAMRKSLRETFGLTSLREGQQQVILQALAGEDTLAVMPTGAGKSLCYQLPALHLDGLTLVISPLIALMQDQIDKLQASGVTAEQLNSHVQAADQAEAMSRIAAGKSELVFTTPERLVDEGFVQALQARRVALFVIDEAHCISQWGHDFRPAYLQLAQAMQALGDPPVLALTATAPAKVIDDIRAELRRPAMRVVHTGMVRDNLRLQVAQCVRDGEKRQRLHEALAKAKGCGIVYTSTVKTCDEVHDDLVASGESVTRYHGRMARADRQANQERFMRGEVRVMVATSAFGMGIDKADLRFVIHYQMPGSPDAYYQEAGRAGRDGDAADCALLFDRRDRQVQQFFLARHRPEADELVAVHRALHAADGPLTLAALAEPSRIAGGLPLAQIKPALRSLREAHLARADRRQAWQAIGEPLTHERAEALLRDADERSDRERHALDRMVFYAQTGFCRWRVLLEYFGEPLPWPDERCGFCDNCLRPPSAAAVAEDEAPPVASPVARFKPGDEVRVPRYGRGLVEEATAEEAAVRFPDGELRRFLAEHVQAEDQA